MRIFMHAFLLLLSISCTGKNAAKESQSSLADVQKKRDFYMSEQEKIKDRFGWIPTGGCDALLYNALAAVAGSSVDVFKAEEGPGRWRRYPDFDRCKPGAGSKSTISKDMFRGLLPLLWKTRNGPALARINHYGDDHGWIMGEAEDYESFYGRVFWFGSPLFVLQIKEMNRELNRKSAVSAGVILVPSDYGFVILRRTFEAHLHVLNIWLRSMINGTIEDYEKLVLQEYARYQPRNALFQILHHKFTDGNYDQAIEILMDENLFPKDSLPTNKNRCAGYLWGSEENQENEYRPCGIEAQHNGIDLTFAVKLMEEN
jgi:hypothetical protein